MGALSPFQLHAKRAIARAITRPRQRPPSRERFICSIEAIGLIRIRNRARTEVFSRLKHRPVVQNWVARQYLTQKPC